MKFYPTTILILLLSFAAYAQQPIQTATFNQGQTDDSGIKVEVQVLIDEYGNVLSAKALSGPAELRKASVTAALKSRFTPTTLRGQAVRVTGVIVYNFKSVVGWEEIGQRLSLLEDGLPDKEFTFPELEKLWSDLAEEKAQYEALIRDTSVGSQSAGAKNLIAAIREKLKNSNPSNLWSFNLGLTISKLQNSAEDDARLQDFQAHLQEFTTLMANPAGNISDLRKDKLNQILKISKTENLNKDKRKELAKLLAVIQP